MNIKRAKYLVLLGFVMMIAVAMLMSTRPSVVSAGTFDETADLYKAKCAMCHGAAAAKFYDPETSDEVHVQVILKGKKGEKPPYMPAFGEKGITEEQAKALAAYMRSLRTPPTVSAEALAEATATYKAKCAMCHGPEAAKFYNVETSDDEHVQVILKGKKAEKPPNMPGFEEKGMTEDQAKALAVYMRSLRTPPAEGSSISQEEAAATYKAKCAMCHGPAAAKFYNPETSDEEHAMVILKGKKGDKPPYMPGFGEKGMADAEAKALAAYMRTIRAGTN